MINSEDQGIETRGAVIEGLLKDTESLSAKSESQDEILIVKSAPELLASALDKASMLDDSLVTDAVLVL